MSQSHDKEPEQACECHGREENRGASRDSGLCFLSLLYDNVAISLGTARWSALAMERRLAAILAADVEGYSRHTEVDEEASTATLRSYCAVEEEAILAHHGHIFSRSGDGVVAEFPSIVEAIRCAIEIQNEIAERNASLPKEGQMKFRIGVNLGDVIAEENNFYGTGVNVAVRLEQLAEPGGICVSQTVYDQVRKIVAIPFQDIGERRLKNISEPVHVYRILPEPLPWLRRFFSRTHMRRWHLRTAGVIVLLILAVAAGAAYLRVPAALWDAVFRTGVPPYPTIAVLPFQDMHPEGQKKEYLANGIAEELRIRLGKFPDLRLIARDSTFKYKDPTDVRQVGADLNVRYVVTGSIQPSDQGIRVTAQLSDATNAQELWSDGYDRGLDSIAAIRDDITRSIAGKLGGLTGKLSQAELKRISLKDPASFTAYDYLLRGWDEWRKFEKEANAEARNLFERARTIDPNYARAYVGLMWTYAIDYDFEWTEDFEKTADRALAMARRAVSLDPDDYQTHWALGWARLYNRQHALAEDSYTRARSLNPNDPELLAEMANFLIYVGRPKQAIDQIIESKRLNPSPESWVDQYLGWAYEEAGMPEQAIETLKPVANEEEPTEYDLWVLPTLAAAYAAVGQTEAANKIVKILALHWPDFSSASVANRAPYKTPELRERYVTALRQAGLPK